jgi:hypothetical protein
VPDVPGKYFVQVQVSDQKSIIPDSLTIIVTEKEPTCLVHNGEDYCMVTSPYTGKVWLDRNIGAARVCTTKFDTECYGDYYSYIYANGRGACPVGFRSPTTIEIDAEIQNYDDAFRGFLKLPSSGYLDNDELKEEGNLGAFWTSTKIDNLPVSFIYGKYGTGSNSVYYHHLSTRCTQR